MATLEVDRLHKSYGDIKALDDCSFDVHSGEVFGFVGSNGAGKTTAMRIMLGVLAADSGEVRWNRKRLDLETRRHVGYMPEERGLYPKMKVGEQLTYLARIHGMSTPDAVAAVEHWTDRLGVGTRRGDHVQKLSLGNQQRVQLAAALIHNPTILVLDEPFSGLDPVAVEVMSQVLRERADEGVPVVFSSHQLDLVERICDRVGIIRSGRMEAVGTVDELRVTDRPQWRLEYGGDAPALREWIKTLPGVKLLPSKGKPGILLLEFRDARPGSEQEILKGALAKGPVHEFSPVRPSLVDLFRGIVSSENGEAA
ncbi:MAG: ATP-binding cassette domain-containing protein [Demequinaceae bacterium]|nr:ATP-binding cassette domain-containing protein [Demequinaceae bacterium]